MAQAIKKGSLEHGGFYGRAAPIAAADSSSPNNPRLPGSETNSSGRWTIGKSYREAKLRAERRNSDPDLPTVPIPAPVSLEQRRRVQNAPRLAHTNQDLSDRAIMPLGQIIPLHQSDPNVVEQSLLALNDSQTAPAPLSPDSLNIGSLIDPHSLDHLHLERITRELHAVVTTPLEVPEQPPVTTPLEMPQQPPPEQADGTLHISAASLLAPEFVSSGGEHTQPSEPDITQQPTIRMRAAPAPPRRIPVPQAMPAPRTHPNPEISSKQKKKKSRSAMSERLASGLARIIQPFYRPNVDKTIRRVLARIENPEERAETAALLEAFVHPPQPQESQREDTFLVAEDTPTDTYSGATVQGRIVYDQYAPYPIPGEYPASKKERALDETLEILTDTNLLQRHGNQPNELVGQDENGGRTQVTFSITENEDVICSTFTDDGRHVQIFMANPFDPTYPHATRMTFGIRPIGKNETLYSLNPTPGEKKRMQHIALEIAALTLYSLQAEQLDPKMKTQLNHLFFCALTNIWNEPLPISQPGQVRFDESTWPYIETIQYDQTMQNAQRFWANFHFYSPAEHGDRETPANNRQTYTEGDLRIDGSFAKPYAKATGRNLFYVLPVQGPPRIIGSEGMPLDNQTNLAALREWSLSLLSALVYRDPRLLSTMEESEHSTISRIDEAILRLQQFLLDFPPGSSLEKSVTEPIPEQ